MLFQMGHNVWSLPNAVQQGNKRYDEGIIPDMLVEERFDRLYFRDIVEAPFATSNRDEANAVIEESASTGCPPLGHVVQQVKRQ